MPSCLKNSKFTLFADDTTVYKETKLTCQQFTEDLIAKKSWFLESGLTVITKKCSLLNVGQKIIVEKSCLGWEIEKLSTCKYLGIIIDKK